jgi:tetratricopeptide (TPR) repeat protein
MADGLGDVDGMAPVLDGEEGPAPLKVFISYAHVDDKHRKELVEHLMPLVDTGVLTLWHDRCLTGGQEWAHEIDAHLAQSDIVLLLVSNSFVASEYCKGVEVKQALEMHAAGRARVIPVVLRSCQWTMLPIGKLQTLPPDAAEITEAPFPDQLYSAVAAGLAAVAKETRSPPAARNTTAGAQRLLSPGLGAGTAVVPPVQRWRMAAGALLLALLLGAGAYAVFVWRQHAQEAQVRAHDEALASIRQDLRADLADAALTKLGQLDAALSARPEVVALRRTAQLSIDRAAADVDLTVWEQRLADAIRQRPNDADLHYLLALAAFEREDSDVFSAAMGAALRIDPSHPAANNLQGLAYDANGQPVEADVYYSSAMREAPSVPQFGTNHARALLDMGRAGDAVPAFERWEDRSILAFAEKALAHWALGEWDEAARSQGYALARLADGNVASQRANRRYHWIFFYRVYDPHQQVVTQRTNLSAAERACYVAMGQKVSQALGAASVQPWVLPPECGAGVLVDDVRLVVAADLCRYVIARQPERAAVAKALRRDWLKQAQPCVPAAPSGPIS